jgi:hypothetical protein
MATKKPPVSKKVAATPTPPKVKSDNSHEIGGVRLTMTAELGRHVTRSARSWSMVINR